MGIDANMSYFEMERQKREFCIGIGFICEVASFVFIGFCLTKEVLVFAIFFLIVGLLWAYAVGKLMKENTLENYKWGLYK